MEEGTIMLDENMEYNEYICDLESDNIVRLMPEIFKWKNRMTGLTRALLIIARKELDDRDYFSENTVNRTQIIEDVKQVLREWLGFSDESGEKLSTYNSWLKRYYAERIQTPEAKDTVKPWSEIEKKKKQYGKKLFSDKKSEKNNILAITYESIIADAIHMGPLKQYYLICKKGYDECLYKMGKQINPKGKKGAEHLDNILKLICVYLIKKKYTGNMANRINNAELGNWAQHKEIFKSEYYKGINYAGKDLIIKKTIKKIYGKYIVCPEYLLAYDFRIITADELDDIPSGYELFSDCGAGKPLLKR